MSGLIDVLEELPTVALLVDSGLWVQGANAEARRYFSIDPSLLPRSLVEVTREGRLVDALRNGATEAEVRLAHRQRTVEVRVREQPPAGKLLLLTDITELRRLQVVRQEFVANLSHELKTPLTSLRLAVESLFNDPPPESRLRFAERALKETDYLSMLVDNLSQLAEIESGGIEVRSAPFELRSLLEEATARTLNGRPVNLEAAADLEVVSDRPKLAEALGILLQNAAKFSPPGSAIDVSATRADGQVIVRVRDRGRGISPEHWERVFERFYKVDQARSREAGGSGLGLAIAKHLVLVLGGRIWTEAAPDGGQIFAIELPVANA